MAILEAGQRQKLLQASDPATFIQTIMGLAVEQPAFEPGEDGSPTGATQQSD
jgi:hypothetical protein